ncbi:MAG: phosphopantetheine-binding protein [Terriglobales bacterium]
MSQEISSWVTEWFSSRGKLSGLRPQILNEILSVNYLEAGLLTSLEIVQFVSELEDRFAIQFSEAEMQDPRFSTIGGIAELVAVARAQKSLDRTSKVG